MLRWAVHKFAQAAIACFLLHIAADQALSQEPIRLYSAPQLFASDYNERVASLKSGDILEFSDSERFIVHRELGHGNTSLILEVSPSHIPSERLALRLPLFNGVTLVDTSKVSSQGLLQPASPPRLAHSYHELFTQLQESLRLEADQTDRETHRQNVDAILATLVPRTKSPNIRLYSFQDHFERYHQSYWNIVNQRIPVPSTPHLKPDDKNSDAREYFLTEPLTSHGLSDKGLYTLADFLYRGHTLEAQQRTMLKNALFDYIKETQYVVELGDFNASQLAFDTDKGAWLLIDWNSPARKTMQRKWAIDHHLVKEVLRAAENKTTTTDDRRILEWRMSLLQSLLKKFMISVRINRPTAATEIEPINKKLRSESCRGISSQIH